MQKPSFIPIYIEMLRLLTISDTLNERSQREVKEQTENEGRQKERRKEPNRYHRTLRLSNSDIRRHYMQLANSIMISHKAPSSAISADCLSGSH